MNTEADPVLKTDDKADALFMMIGASIDPEHDRYTEYLPGVVDLLLGLGATPLAQFGVIGISTKGGTN